MPEPETVETPGQTNLVPDRATERRQVPFAGPTAPNKPNLLIAKIDVRLCKIVIYVGLAGVGGGENKAKQSQSPAYRPPVSGVEPVWRRVVDTAVLRYFDGCEVGTTGYWLPIRWRHTS